MVRVRVCLLALSLGACEAFGTSPSTPVVAPDAGEVREDAGGTTPDAAMPGEPPQPGCTVVLADTFGGPMLPPGWRVDGVAKLDAGRVVLTPHSDSVSGALFRTTPMRFAGTVTVTVTYTIEDGPKGQGSGMAIAVVAGSAPIVGDTNLNYGICGKGQKGVAVSVERSFDNRLLALDTIEKECGTEGGITNDARVATKGTLVATFARQLLHLQHGALEVKRTDAVVPDEGTLGITASTGIGDGQSSFAVLAVRVESCP